MKKRPKLDLSSAGKKEKAQATGFNPETEPDPVPEPKSQNTASRTSSTRQQSSFVEAAIKQRSSRTMILTSVALVAVVAVSLFVLKRR